MKVLVIGSGGREHALVQSLALSSKVQKIWCAPGNAGIAQDAECVAIKADDIMRLLQFAKDNQVDLTMVGPEAPLVSGLVDHFRREGLKVVGPTANAARLEGSKSYAKDFMHKYGIPTARYEIIPNLTRGTYVLKHWPHGSVVKADGLAAGKGVKVCSNQQEASEFLYELMENEVFGSAGSTALIEECLEGEETTLMAFCDGRSLVLMPPSQDHKRLLDGDQGPNTGGMGAYAPAPVVTAKLLEEINRTVAQPFLKGIQAEGYDFRGIIYFGLMLTKDGPKVLEFNVRFGDPETQVILPLLKTDLVDVLSALADGDLQRITVEWHQKASCCVVLAAGGYPGEVKKGELITGLEETQQIKDVLITHAGTERSSEGVQTNGGRVLGITGLGATIQAAQKKAYEAVSKVSFPNMQFRRDIAYRALTPRPKQAAVMES